MPRPRRDFTRDRGAAEAPPPRPCDHAGCDQHGEFRAPRSRDRDCGHYWFCLAHVRNYNAAWDFFAGMSQQEIESYQRGNATWHRPTWRLGQTGREAPSGASWYDPFDLLQEGGFTAGPQPAEAAVRPLNPAERRALADLDLHPMVTREQIKKRYKELVKRFHPDANGGDSAAEERLKQINQSYNYLLSCGYT